jgi:hypothetical protein
VTWGHAESWRDAGRALGLDLEGPLELRLATGVVTIDLLVREFGALNGTAIVSDYDAFWPHREALLAEGYTASYFSPPPLGEPLSREDVIELLADWGWAGPPARRPAWLPAG